MSNLTIGHSRGGMSVTEPTKTKAQALVVSMGTRVVGEEYILPQSNLERVLAQMLQRILVARQTPEGKALISDYKENRISKEEFRKNLYVIVESINGG